MSNIPGAPGALPGVFTDVVTQSRGVAINSGIRVSCIVGEGLRSEVIVSSANGGGNDGFNSSYTSTSGSDGRHFTLTYAPVISNRTTLYKNGLPLVGLEASIDNNPFSFVYDYRIDISTGRIQLQASQLVDQGGTYYSTGSTNVGVGVVDGYGGSGIKLIDTNAPTETWTIKCISVLRNNLNQPIAGTAKFIAFGSVSGNVLDANGNVITWIANGQEVNNGILSFNITETTVGGNAVSVFREGDYFTIQVKGGVLVKNDTLTATYISVADINDPTFFTDMASLTAKHGSVSLTNRLSLGAQLAFDNGTPGVLAMQAAPPLPRRTSYVLESTFNSLSTNPDDYKLPLPYGVTPNLTSDIHFFVTNPATGVETQILPNKYSFYTLDTAGNPTSSQFIFSAVNPPSGYNYSYTVTSSSATLNFATDGYLNRNLTSQTLATLSTGTATFGLSYVGKQVKIIDSNNLANIGTFSIVGVSNGMLNISATGSPPFSAYVNDAACSFQLINPVTGLTVGGSSGTDGTLVSIPSTSTGTLHSVAVNFNSFAGLGLLGLKLKITASTTATNLGLFDITGYNSGTNTLTIAKSFVSESNLKFEVLDPTNTSNYVVVNQNVVPNGYSVRVTIVDSRDFSFYDAGWLTALSTLEAFELDILVPLPSSTISAVFENSLNHCITMSNTLNRKERVLFIGAINGLTPDNLTGAKLAAVENIGILEGIQGATVSDILAGKTEDLANYSVPNAYGNTYRCVYFYPDQIVVEVGGDNQIIDGFYLAAAAAGYCSATSNISMPLTNKVLSGFTILKNKTFSNTVLTNLANAGVCVLQPVSGGGKVVWGLTTTQSGYPEEQEISIVFIRDRVAKSLRAGFAGYVGLPEDIDTISVLTTRAKALLNGFVSQKLITDWADLVVSRDSVDPRQWDISVRVQPTYPINWIYIRVGIGQI